MNKFNTPDDLKKLASDVHDRFSWRQSPDKHGEHSVDDDAIKQVILLTNAILNDEPLQRERVWYCHKTYMCGDGGRTHSQKYVKTVQDMMIYRHQGYECTEIVDEEAAKPNNQEFTENKTESIISWVKPFFADKDGEPYHKGDLIDFEFHNRVERPRGTGWQPLYLKHEGLSWKK